jgi:hypothetical protein
LGCAPTSLSTPSSYRSRLSEVAGSEHAHRSLRRKLGDDRFYQLWAKGRDTPIDQAVSTALAFVE